eukprot:UN09967
MEPKHPKIKIMRHPLNETTRLVHPKSHHLNYGTIFFLMGYRALNLVFYKTLPTFSWYFAQYFEMNYTIFAVTVLNVGSIVNMPIAPYYSQFEAKYVMIIFALILAGSCLLVLQWHTIACLLIARLMSTFAITATRSEVNHIIGAYTQRRARSIGIIEMSFGLSALGYILVAIVLQQFGYKILFIGYCILITVIAICLYLLLDKKIKHKQTSPSSLYVQISELKKALTHKRLQLIFISVLLNKIA